MSDETYNICIIDDVKAICNSLTRELMKIARDNKIRFKVNDLQDSHDGLEYVLKYRLDLVISDIKMPYMTGDVLIQKIKEEKPDLPIVVITGFATKEKIISIYQTDKSIVILSKPWDSEKLTEAIGDGLNLKLKYIPED